MLQQLTPSQPVPAVADTVDALKTVVERAIAELRPHLKRDGGDIELIDIDGDRVIVDMTGNCSDCALASVTLAGVKKKLVEATGRPLRVIPLAAVTALGLSFPKRQVAQ